MFPVHPHHSTASRRGVVLMVVLILLTLFAIVGLSFVLYASSAAKSAQLAREAEFQNQNFPDIDPNVLMSYFLGQLIYDTDDIHGIASAMRGHSLARTMYGLNGNYSTNLTTRQTTFTPANNVVPFNGTGRLHTTKATFNNPIGIDDYFLVNYTYFQNEQTPFLRDPERLGHGAAGPLGQLSGFRRGPSELPGPYVGGFNAPYTYPDLNNMFLAAVKAGPIVDATGKILAPPGAVLMQSFHRPYTGFGTLDPSNPFWTLGPDDHWFSYLVLRPRPFDMGPGFPLPEDAGGDVKNLVGSPGYYDPVAQKLCNNDSIWMDLGFPVMVAPNGKKFKPLFAPLITDVDNRINVNVHGNIRAQDPQTGKWLHCSNQGWGPWEVNLGRVLSARNPSDPTDTDPNNPKEWTNLFTGTNAPPQPNVSQPTQYGRYGYTRSSLTGTEPLPHPHALTGNVAANPFLPPPTLSLPPFYSQIDYDGSKDDWQMGRVMSPPTTVASPVLLPGGSPAGAQQQQQQFTSFPTYPPGYGNASSASNELMNHPLLYNFFQPYADDRRFRSSNMEALLRYMETGSQSLTSELFRLCPINFSDPKIRGLVTTRSFDLDRPGVRAWLPNYQVGSYTLDLTVSPPRYPQATASPQTSAIPFPTDPRNVGGEFLRNDGRAADAVLGRIDLNRLLPPYPVPNATTGRINSSDLNAFAAAQAARVQLAQDIYDRLRLVTTGTMADPKSLGITLKARPQDFYALQWLAQLAVNIVDYIDADDYMTPFQWNTDDQGNPIYVYGTELPRVVLNEAYAETRNDPSDPGITGPQKKATTNYITNFWVELLNTFSPYPTRQDSGVARLQAPPSQGYPKGYAVYQLKIAKAPSLKIRDASNVTGDPDPGNVVLTISDFSPPGNQPVANQDQLYNVIQPAANPSIYNGTPGTNQNGFYVLGPSNPKWSTFEGFQGNNPFVPTLQVKDERTNLTTTNSMSYVVPVQNATATPGQYGLFLQRLACPALPPTGPGLPYNPYITVDYIEVLTANNAIQFTTNGSNVVNYQAPQARASYGRNQPYAADKSQLKRQSPQPPLTGMPQHTFFRHNAKEAMPPIKGGSLLNTLNYPFNWLQQGDRPLISPLEILHVSAFKPHELTQQFYTKPWAGNGPQAPYQHRAANAILDERSRLYRIFEFLETGDRASGTANGARIPGRVNINTVWDGETLLALCDPQSSNAFAPALTVYNPNNPYDPSTLFGKLIALPQFSSNGRADSAARTPGLPTGQVGPTGPLFIGQPVPTDRPFLGMATALGNQGDPQYPNRGVGLNDTLLRLTGGYPAPALFEVQSQLTPHPSQWDELLNKIANNLTTRSNVFAVWLTVGFFEVVQDTDAQGNPIYPVKLGAEIGRSENRNKRHRMFAIVDRTNLRVPLSGPPTFTEAPPVFLRATSAVSVPPASRSPLPYPNPTQVTVSVDALSGTYEGLSWQITKGTQMLVDVGLDPTTPPGVGLDPYAAPAAANTRLPHQEFVTVTSVGNNTFTAQFSYPHPAGFVINLNARPGNPGPQPSYDPQRDTAVVRYLSIIE